MHGMALKDIETRLETLIDPIMTEEGIRLVSVDVERRGKRLVVTVCLDRQGGIDVDTCAEMSEEISRYLDVEDIISEKYNLEVESPGLQRILRKPREFNCFLGREVEILLRQTFEGRQKMRGRLIAADEEGITVHVDGEELSFPYQALKKTKLYFAAPW
jgi:ribosome maturation factor RimP